MVRHYPRVSAGFTLLEVLVAFVILLLAFAVVLRIFATGSRGVVASDDVNRAVAYAQANLAEVGITEPLQSGDSHGELPDGYTWQRSIRPYPTDDAAVSLRVPPLYEVTAWIRWERKGRDREISLSSLRLGPAPDTVVGMAP